MNSPVQVSATLEIKRQPGKIFSHLRQKWLVETPEERVRQQYLITLVNEYGFTLDQMKEEQQLTGRGSAQARADFVLWRTAQDCTDNKAPLIVIECKADNVTISEKDYFQGENYARFVDAPFSSPTTTGKPATGAFSKTKCRDTVKKSPTFPTPTQLRNRLTNSTKN